MSARLTVSQLLWWFTDWYWNILAHWTVSILQQFTYRRHTFQVLHWTVSTLLPIPYLRQAFLTVPSTILSAKLVFICLSSACRDIFSLFVPIKYIYIFYAFLPAMTSKCNNSRSFAWRFPLRTGLWRCCHHSLIFVRPFWLCLQQTSLNKSASICLSDVCWGVFSLFARIFYLDIFYAFLTAMISNSLHWEWILLVNVEEDFVHRFTTGWNKFVMNPLSTSVSSYGKEFYFVYFASFNLLALPKVIIWFDCE